jgi:hypothetical protein
VGGDAGSKSVLGGLRRYSLENFAADEELGPDHWFWNERASGGIFVEHGVHFFDLFGWQLGQMPERVVALETMRESGIADTVQATVQYSGGATGSFYHAFTRAKAAEHQGITFGWDWATAELRGWIALDLEMAALLDDEGLEALSTLLSNADGLLKIPGEQPLPGAKIEWQVKERFQGGQVMRGRGEERRITARVHLRATLGGQEAKMVVYEQCVRAGMSGLLAAMSYHEAKRRHGSGVVSAIDLWASTAAAVAAREAAASHREIAIEAVPDWLR